MSAGHLPEVGVVAVGQQWVGQLSQEQLEAPGQNVDVILSVEPLEGVPLALVNINPDLLDLGGVPGHPVDPLGRKVVRLALNPLDTFPQELGNLQELY